MIQRSILPEVQHALTYFPVVGIIGPRQVGKTTLAKVLEKGLNQPTLFLDLERDSDRRKLAEPELFLQKYSDRCIIIDEIQNLPTLLPLIRWLVDQDRRPARFILTGSISPDIIKDCTETLAGRIAYFELMPFSLLEIGNIKMQKEHWFRGGFPNALLAPNEFLREIWLDNFVETFLYRDIRHIREDVTALELQRLLKMIASTNGNLLNIEGLSDTSGIGSNTIKKYLDILEGSFLLRRLQPFYMNTTKRLVRSPKVYVRDTGLLHRLIDIRDFEQLHGSMWLGNSWETYVIEEIIKVGGKAFEYSFYRTRSGNEVDLILRGELGKLAMIEIKYSTNPTPSKGFYLTAEELNPDFKYIIVPEGEAWERSNSVVVCGLLWFLTNEMNKF